MAHSLGLARHVLGYVYPGWRREARLTPGYGEIAALRLRRKTRVSRIREFKWSGHILHIQRLRYGTETEIITSAFSPGLSPSHINTIRPHKSKSHDGAQYLPSLVGASIAMHERYWENSQVVRFGRQWPAAILAGIAQPDRTRINRPAAALDVVDLLGARRDGKGRQVGLQASEGLDSYSQETQETPRKTQVSAILPEVSLCGEYALQDSNL